VLLVVFGFMSWEILLLHLNEVFTLVCLKRLVIFLISGDTYVNVVHLVLDPVGGVVRVILYCICCLIPIRMFSVQLLLLAISVIVAHSLCWCSLLGVKVNILSM
jgi:hypothetical protein